MIHASSIFCTQPQGLLATVLQMITYGESVWPALVSFRLFLLQLGSNTGTAWQQLSQKSISWPSIGSKRCVLSSNYTPFAAGQHWQAIQAFSTILHPNPESQPAVRVVLLRHDGVAPHDLTCTT
jgi:hypothetical protein